MLKELREKFQPLMMADAQADSQGAAYDEFEDDDDSIEIVPPGQEVEEEAEEDTETVKLSKAEFEALKNSANSVEAMRESIGELGQSLKGGRQPEPVNETPQQQEGESDEAFWKRFSKDLFESDNPKPLFEEMLNRMAGPLVNQQNAELAKANKRLMQMDPERGQRFKKYQEEIESFVKALPKQQQTHPQVWEYAYGEVLKRHTDDLINEEVEKRMQERMAEREAGTHSEVPQPQRKPVQQTTGAGSGSLSPQKKKRRVALTARDYEIMRKEGMSERDYAEWKARNM